MNEPNVEMALNIFQKAENESMGLLFNYGVFKKAHNKNIDELKNLLYDANVCFLKRYCDMGTTQKITYKNIVKKLEFNPETYIPCKHKYHGDNMFLHFLFYY